MPANVVITAFEKFWTVPLVMAPVAELMEKKMYDTIDRENEAESTLIEAAYQKTFARVNAAPEAIVMGRGYCP